jgi:hypothetical protein
LIIFSAFEPPAPTSDFDDIAVIGQVVEQRGRRLPLALQRL